MKVINSVLVIGAGLIGASVGLALKERNLCNKLGFIDSDNDNLLKAREHQLTDWVANDISSIRSDLLDLIIVATPTLVSKDIILELLNTVGEDVYITDVASTKTHFKSITAKNYIPGHPIAGREHSGFDAADINLFRLAKVVLTPHGNCSPQGIELISQMWEELGANICYMTPERHDNLFAYSSHLPHLIAYSLTYSLANNEIKDDIVANSAGGLRDYTRVAASDADMWHDICISNRDCILDALSSFELAVAELKNSITAGDSDAIYRILTKAKELKKKMS